MERRILPHMDMWTWLPLHSRSFKLLFSKVFLRPVHVELLDEAPGRPALYLSRVHSLLVKRQPSDKSPGLRENVSRAVVYTSAAEPGIVVVSTSRRIA